MKVVRNFCLSLLCLFAMASVSPRSGQAATNDQFVALQALNHGLLAVEMVLRDPCRATVDAQRFAIVEQLEIPASVLKAKGRDKDKDNENSLQSLFQELDRIFRESGNDATGLAKAREAEEAVVTAALAKVPSATPLVAGSARASFKPLAKGVMGNGPLGSLLSLAENPADHHQPLAIMTDDSVEKLDQAVIDRFTSLRQQLLAVRDEFVSKSRLPAREVMTAERIALFLELADKAGQPDLAMPLARKCEKELSFWPPYWFYYGKIAQAKGNDSLARRCFRELERRSRSCLKRNTYQAAQALNRISMLDSEEAAEAKRLLEIMNRNLTPADWPKGLVAGLQYYTLGDRRRAEEQIQRNASELKVLVPVHARLLGLLKAKNFAVSDLLAETGADQESGKTESDKAGSDKAGSGKADQPAAPEQKKMADAPEKALASPQEVLPDASSGSPLGAAPEASAGASSDSPAVAPAEDPVPQPDSDSSARPVEEEKPESANGGPAQSDLAVGNVKSGEAAGGRDKASAPAGQAGQTDKADAKSLNGQKDGQKDAPKDGQKASKPESEKQGKTLPASGKIGSRPEADKGQGDSKGTVGEDAKLSGQPAATEDKDGKKASPEKGTGPAKDPGQAGKPDAAAGSGEDKAGRSGQGEQENSQAAEQDSTANAKDAKALYLLAMSHYRGENGKKDLARAIILLTQAAGQGNADAQSQLGFFHYTGNGVAKDKAKAVSYFSQAAEQGNTNAMFNLAVCYHSGDGVEKDIARAVELYTTAALKGETRSQYNLAMLYYRGEGVEKDVPRARKLLESLSAQGFVPARKVMEYLDNPRQAKEEQTKQ